jgi:hypothetical protein
MRISPASLSGTTLRFDRSGRRLIVLEPDEIAVVDPGAALAIRLAFRGARGVVGFDDELWIATHDDRLVRVDPTGAMLGAPVALPCADHAVLAPAPCGPPAAVWSAGAPVVCSLAPAPAPAGSWSLGPRRPAYQRAADTAAEPGLVCVEAADADAIIPITGQRVIAARGSRLTLPSGLSVALAPNSQVLGGCVTGDGRWLTLLVAHRAERRLVMVSLGLGQVMHRRSVPPRATVAVAAGVAAIQIEPRVLRVIDLITNRDLGGVSFGHDVAAFAVGPTGRALATRSTTGELELHRIDPLFPRPFAAAQRAGAPRAARADLTAPRVLLAGDASPATEADAPLADAHPADAPPADVPPADVPVTDASSTDALSDAALSDAALSDAALSDAALFNDAPATELELRAHCPARASTPWLLDRVAATPALDAPIAPFASEPAAIAPAVDEVGVHSYSAPTVHATDWLCGSGDYLDGGA